MSTYQRAFVADERPSLTHAAKTPDNYTLCGRLGSPRQGEFVLGEPKNCLACNRAASGSGARLGSD